MSALRFQSSRPNEWIAPRQHLDAHQRYRAYGPVQPMDYAQPGLLQRLMGYR